ncbi:MAG: LysR family transcriptional regulator [Planctomycetota bacterium]
MSLARLRSLAEIARRGGISPAAKALGLTQPALSRQIQLLEEQFGAALLVRSRRGVTLTDLGKLVEAEGRALLERYERLRETVQAHLRLERGTVRIGGGATAVTAILPEVIREFRREHADVVFHVKEAGSRAVEEEVLREEVELGIVTLPVTSRELDVAPLGSDEIVLVAARDHALAKRARVPAQALEGESLVCFERGSAIRRIIDRALEARGVRMRVVMELRSIQPILRMVGLGLGLGFVSRLGVDAGDRRIRVVDLTGLKITRTLAVITKRGRPLSLAAEAFLRKLRARSG